MIHLRLSTSTLSLVKWFCAYLCPTQFRPNRFSFHSLSNSKLKLIEHSLFVNGLVRATITIRRMIYQLPKRTIVMTVISEKEKVNLLDQLDDQYERALERKDVRPENVLSK